MSIVQVVAYRKERNFTNIDNDLINNQDVSLEARMFLIWFLSKQNYINPFEVNTKSLSTMLKIGKDKVTTISKELQKSGYLIIKKLSTGQTMWLFYESPEIMRETRMVEPHPENPDMAKKPHPEKPDPENPDALIRTDLLKRTEDRVDSISLNDSKDIKATSNPVKSRGDILSPPNRPDSWNDLKDSVILETVEKLTIENGAHLKSWFMEIWERFKQSNLEKNEPVGKFDSIRKRFYSYATTCYQNQKSKSSSPPKARNEQPSIASQQPFGAPAIPKGVKPDESIKERLKQIKQGVRV